MGRRAEVTAAAVVVAVKITLTSNNIKYSLRSSPCAYHVVVTTRCMYQQKLKDNIIIVSWITNVRDLFTVPSKMTDRSFMNIQDSIWRSHNLSFLHHAKHTLILLVAFRVSYRGLSRSSSVVHSFFAVDGGVGLMYVSTTTSHQP